MVEQSERHPRSPGTVQSVDRALDVLEVLARGEGSVGVGELAAATGLPQGTAHRLLRSLQARGYVRNDTSRKYALGAAAFLLGDATQRSFHQRAARTVNQVGRAPRPAPPVGRTRAPIKGVVR